MLTQLLLSLTCQLPMQAIIHEPVKPALDTKAVIRVEVPVEKVVTKVTYIGIDKFGHEHAGESREDIVRKVREANTKPYNMTDAAGQTWTHQDEIYLKRFIEERNRVLQYRN